MGIQKLGTTLAENIARTTKIVATGGIKKTANTSSFITGALEKTPTIEHFERVATRFRKPDILDPIMQDYIKKINTVPVEGGVTKEELPILNLVHESMFGMLKRTQGKSPLYKRIVFEYARPNGIIRKDGVAYVDWKTGSLHVNRDYFENIDNNIKGNLKTFMDLGWITKDKNGKYKIVDHLRNSKSEIFEKRLNEYSPNWSLRDKFLFHRVSMNYYSNLTYQAYGHPILTIGKIMNNGNNKQILKQLGLFKTRDEVIKMGLKGQVAYLEQIGKHCPPPVDTCLVTYPEFIFNHESIHRFHRDCMSIKMRQELCSEAKIQEWKTNKRIQTTTAKVSGYAGTQPVEFVAEVGGGLAKGQTFDNDVMSLYEYLKGPKL